MSSEQQASSKVPQLHGLIIGINKYQRPELHLDLVGCVSDAQSMLKYFTEHLGAPEGNFRCLYDEDATRDAIIKAFMNDLINNPNIKRHDPIVIYYAGHGDRMPAPRGWQTPDGKVEMILTHDTSTRDKNGFYIYGIPDLTLAFLLYKLSQKKGNNITVILDSCHSGSATRGEVRSRNSHDPKAPAMPDILDVQVRRSLSVDYPSEVEHNIGVKQSSGTLLAPSLETHILLAACQDDELAQEIPVIDAESGELADPPCTGLFTSTLLKELYKCDPATTSYTTLIRNILAASRPKIPYHVAPQTFQCEGRNQDRLLFSVQYSISKGKIGLIPTNDKSVYRVRVGSAQGIVAGTEFGVFSGKMDPTAPPLAILVAKDVGPIISQLHGTEPNAPPKIPPDSYTTIIRYNDHASGVRIWVHDDVKRNPLWEIIFITLNSLPIYWATSPENQDLELLPSDKGIAIRGTHLVPGKFEASHVIDQERGPKSLAESLTAVIYFHFHLKIQNKEAPVRALLQMRLLELKEKDGNWGSPIYETNGEDVFGESVSDGTVVAVRPDPDRIFGLEVTNNSQESLFPYVLYYDFEDYSVTCLYEPPGRSSKPPLETGKTLTIGYGSSGAQPFQIEFTRPGSTKEHGAFVLLVFSEWADIAYLQQESPLGLASFDGRGNRRGSRTGIWDTLVVRVELTNEK